MLGSLVNSCYVNRIIKIYGETVQMIYFLLCDSHNNQKNAPLKTFWIDRRRSQ